MKGLGYFVILIFCSLPVFSQKNLSLSGTLIDITNNHEPVDAASVGLLTQKDSAYISGGISDKNGKFTLRNLAPNNYILKITYIGYLPVFKNVKLSADKPATDLGQIEMTPNAVLLKEAIVEGKKPEIIVKEDTTEYDASSYKTTENAVVEDLLKKLPGVEVDKDGKITAQGKSVSKVFVNGKEFFRDDPTAATKNMPADMVEKVQIYDRKSDMAQMTGFDNGDEETVMNLQLPPGMMQGTVGNVQIGGGYDLQPDINDNKDARYTGSAFVRHQRGSDSYTLISRVNNTNNMGGADITGGGGGGGRGGVSGGVTFGGNMSGITKAQNYMLNINKEIKRDTLSINGDIRFNRQDRSITSYSNQQNFLQNGTQMEIINQTNHNYGNNINANVRIDWKPNKQNTFIFRPTIRYNQSNSNGLMYDTRTNVNTDSVLLDSKSLTSSNRNNLGFGGSLDYSLKLPKEGRVFSVNMNGNYSNNYAPQKNITYYPANSTDSLYSLLWQNQMAENRSLTNSYNSTFSYVEPLGHNNYVQLLYRYSYSETESRNSTYNILQNYLLSSGIAAFDTALFIPKQSRTTLRDAIDQRVGLNFKMDRKKFNLTFGFNVDPSRSTNDTYQPKYDVLPPQMIPPDFDGKLPLIKGDSLFSHTPIKVINYSPTVNFRYRIDQRSNLRIIYEGETNQPSANQLRNYDYVDINSPNDITRGNPDLKPGYDNNLRIEFNKYVTSTQMMYRFAMNGSYSVNDIVSFTVLQKSGKGNLTTYQNVNGNWTAFLMGMINVPLNKKFSVGNMLRSNIINSNSFIGSENQLKKNTMKSNTIGDNLNLRLQLNENFYIGAVGSINYNNITYTAVSDKNQNLYDYSGGANILWTFLPSWTFDSDINRTWKKGYPAGYNITQTLWNAAITKVLFKKQSGTGSARLQIFDILQDRKNISASQTASNLQFSQANVIPSYFLASFIYRFSIFPKSSLLKAGDMEQRRGFDMPGGRPGGGRPDGGGGGGRPDGGGGGFPGGGRPPQF